MSGELLWMDQIIPEQLEQPQNLPQMGSSSGIHPQIHPWISPQIHPWINPWDPALHQCLDLPVDSSLGSIPGSIPDPSLGSIPGIHPWLYAWDFPWIFPLFQAKCANRIQQDPRNISPGYLPFPHPNVPKGPRNISPGPFPFSSPNGIPGIYPWDSIWAGINRIQEYFPFSSSKVPTESNRISGIFSMDVSLFSAQMCQQDPGIFPMTVPLFQPKALTVSLPSVPSTGAFSRCFPGVFPVLSRFSLQQELFSLGRCRLAEPSPARAGIMGGDTPLMGTGHPGGDSSGTARADHSAVTSPLAAAPDQTPLPARARHGSVRDGEKPGEK